MAGNKKKMTIGERLAEVRSKTPSPEHNVTKAEAVKMVFDKPQKIKRSYMLTEETIRQIENLTRLQPTLNYSDIVTWCVQETTDKYREHIKNAVLNDFQ